MEHYRQKGRQMHNLGVPTSGNPRPRKREHAPGGPNASGRESWQGRRPAIGVRATSHKARVGMIPKPLQTVQ
eukprot:9249326-Prorocentrum_lima.AAC.1